MEMVGRISKGTIMDQIYIPKNRIGLAAGSYVVIKPLESEKVIERPYFYNVKSIEPIKLEIVNAAISIINEEINNENIIITGSFLEKGFGFNDIDIIIISENKSRNILSLKNNLKEKTGVGFHIIILDNQSLIKGLQTDPLYQMMLSKCISKKRILYKIKTEVNFKILDLHLLKSELLIDNFDILKGDEKYYLIRNSVVISLYLKHKKINKEIVDNEIKKIFGLKNIDEIKENMLDKEKFLKKYKMFHSQVFKKILEGIKNGSKQEKAA